LCRAFNVLTKGSNLCRHWFGLGGAPKSQLFESNSPEMPTTAHNPPEKIERDPLLALAMGDISGVLAFVIRTEGPSYRAVGAAMVFHCDGAQTGSLSSGCIEADLALHAKKVQATNTPLRIIYGNGSPFMDIQLPCGGGLEVLLLPQPHTDELALIAKVVIHRRPLDIAISLETGRITENLPSGTGISSNHFNHQIIAPLCFVVFGKGPEAVTFAKLVHSLGYSGTLVSPDQDTINSAQIAGCTTCEILHPKCPNDIALDDRTAVVCFFHDHDWEAPILSDILDRKMFYIGCQGSKQTSVNRLAELERLGVSRQNRQKVRGPIGLIPSVRDSNTLAVSVLAEVLSI
jgi:xanthine dehydrogenase accessory factor